MSSKDLQIIEVEEIQAEIETAPTKSKEKMTFSNSLPEHPLNHASSFQSRLKDQHVVPESEDQPEDQESLSQNKLFTMTEYVPEDKVQPKDQSKDQFEDQEFLRQYQEHVMNVEECVLEDENQPENQPEKQPKAEPEDQGCLPQNHQYGIKILESFSENEQLISEDQESLSQNQQFNMKFEEFVPEAEDQPENQQHKYHLEDKESLPQNQELNLKDSGCCPDCLKQFSSMSALGYHLLQHKNPKKFFCKLCDRFLPLPKQTLHSKLHAKVGNKFKCKICDKFFIKDGSLANHNKIHEGFKYRCKYCPRSFFQKSNLNVHIKKMHKFKSKICDKVLVNKGSLINPNDLKYRCKSCPKSFNHKKNLNVHVEKMHSSWSLKP